MNEEYVLKFTSITKLGQTANTQITIQNGLEEKNLLRKTFTRMVNMVRIWIIRTYTHNIHKNITYVQTQEQLMYVAIPNYILKR